MMHGQQNIKNIKRGFVDLCTSKVATLSREADEKILLLLFKKTEP